MSRATPDFDPASVDVEAFHADIRALRAEIDASVGEEDLRHLRRIETWGRVASLLGLAVSWIAPNPLSAAGMGLGRSTRWLLMHHVGHRGYDRVPGAPVERTSKGFAKGHRRFVDWLDWILPDAWVFEHNVLHHSHTGEERDPEVIEQIRRQYRLDQPIPIQYLYWMKGVFTGDLGESMRLKVPVLDLIAQKLPVTLQLATMAMVIALVIGVSAGVISAVKKDTVWDYAVNVVALWGISTLVTVG